MSDESYDFINMIIMIVISFLFAVLIPGLGLIRHLIEKNKNNWEITTARITGKANKYMESNISDGYYSVPESTTDYQIEFFANNKKIIKYVSESETGGRTHGKIRIKYLKRRPGIFRVL